MRSGLATALIGLCALATSLPVEAGTPANAEAFRVRSAADLVALCDTPADADTAVAAIHFCHGFAVGAFQYYLATTERSPDQRFVCIPDPPPTRDQAIAAFVAWVKEQPERANEAAVDALFRFLAEAYPCSR